MVATPCRETPRRGFTDIDGEKSANSLRMVLFPRSLPLSLCPSSLSLLRGGVGRLCVSFPLCLPLPLPLPLSLPPSPPPPLILPPSTGGSRIVLDSPYAARKFVGLNSTSLYMITVFPPKSDLTRISLKPPGDLSILKTTGALRALSLFWIMFRRASTADATLSLCFCSFDGCINSTTMKYDRHTIIYHEGYGITEFHRDVILRRR